jgi:hypothetical protein
MRKRARRADEAVHDIADIVEAAAAVVESEAVRPAIAAGDGEGRALAAGDPTGNARR